MYVAATVPSPVWALLGAVTGAAFKAAIDVWRARQEAKTDERKTSGSVESSDAKIVFDAQQGVFTAQQAALVMSEQMRHDLRDQVERCQGEIQKLKDENDEQDARQKAQAIENAHHMAEYRKRIEVLEEELDDMSERLRREEQRGQQ